VADIKVHGPFKKKVWRGWGDFPTDIAWHLEADETILLEIPKSLGGYPRHFTADEAEDLKVTLAAAIRHARNQE